MANKKKPATSARRTSRTQDPQIDAQILREPGRQIRVVETSGAGVATRRNIAVVAVLAFLVLAVYARAVAFDFVNYDDWEYVLKNPHVNTGLTAENVVWTFQHFDAANWHPLTFVSLMLDANLYRMKPGGFHATNIILHTANVLLLFAVLMQMTGSRGKSAFVAALFAVHPQHVESVAWIVERKDVLSTFFGLLCILAFLRHVRLDSWRWYGVALALYVCSLLSKQTLVTLPFLLLVCDWWPLGRTPWNQGEGKRKSWKFLLLEKLPFLLVGICFSLVVVQAQGDAVSQIQRLSLATRLANAVVAYVLYIFHAIWPAGLAVIYPHPGTQIPVWQVVGALAVLFTITGSVVWLRKKHPYLLTGWLWFVGTMIPMIGIVQVGTQQMADRYAYFPCIGLYLAAVWLAATLFGSELRRVTAPALGACAIVALAVVAWRQVGYWRNSETLFRRTLAVTENNSVAHSNLAQVLDERAREYYDAKQIPEARKEISSALDHLSEALRLDPSTATVQKNFGKALLLNYQLHRPKSNRNDLNAAIDHLRKGLELDPLATDRDVVHYELGNLLAELGRFKEASEEYRQAIELTPDYAVAYLNLSRVLASQIQFEEALDAARLAIELEPKRQEPIRQLVRVHRQFGSALASNGKLDEAIVQFQQAVQLSPASASAHFLLAKALAQKGRTDAAIEEYNLSLARRPTPETHYELAMLLLAMGKRETAVAHLRNALSLRPEYPEAKNALSKAVSGT